MVTQFHRGLLKYGGEREEEWSEWDGATDAVRPRHETQSDHLAPPPNLLRGKDEREGEERGGQ